MDPSHNQTYSPPPDVATCRTVLITYQFSIFIRSSSSCANHPNAAHRGNPGVCQCLETYGHFRFAADKTSGNSILRIVESCSRAVCLKPRNLGTFDKDLKVPCSRFEAELVEIGHDDSHLLAGIDRQVERKPSRAAAIRAPVRAWRRTIGRIALIVALPLGLSVTRLDEAGRRRFQFARAFALGNHLSSAALELRRSDDIEVQAV